MRKILFFPSPNALPIYVIINNTINIILFIYYTNRYDVCIRNSNKLQLYYFYKVQYYLYQFAFSRHRTNHFTHHSMVILITKGNIRIINKNKKHAHNTNNNDIMSSVVAQVRTFIINVPKSSAFSML